MRAFISPWGKLIAFAAAVLVAVQQQQLLVDTGHIDPIIWGAEVPLIWAVLGFAATVVTAALAHAAVRYGLHREHDPYDDGGDAGG